MSNTVNDLLRRIRALESGTGIGAGGTFSTGGTGTGGSGGTTVAAIPNPVIITDGTATDGKFEVLVSGATTFAGIYGNSADTSPLAQLYEKDTTDGASAVAGFQVTNSYTQTLQPTALPQGTPLLIKNDSVMSDTDSGFGPTAATSLYGPRALVNLEGTTQLAADQNTFAFTPIAFGDMMTEQNQVGANRTMVPGWRYMVASTTIADTNTLTLARNDIEHGRAGFVDSQTFFTVNGGTLNGTTNSYNIISFLSMPFTQGNSHIATRTGVKINDMNQYLDTPGTVLSAIKSPGGVPSDAGLGVIDTQYGIYIDSLTQATTNIGFYNKASTVLAKPGGTQLLVTDGTAAHGAIDISVDQILGSGIQTIAFFASSTSLTNPSINLSMTNGANPTLQLGPGTGAADWTLTRTGTATATISGQVNITDGTAGDGAIVLDVGNVGAGIQAMGFYASSSSLTNPSIYLSMTNGTNPSLQFGSGSAATDITIQRTAASTLGINASASLGTKTGAFDVLDVATAATVTMNGTSLLFSGIVLSPVATYNNPAGGALSQEYVGFTENATIQGATGASDHIRGFYTSFFAKPQIKTLDTNAQTLDSYSSFIAQPTMTVAASGSLTVSSLNQFNAAAVTVPTGATVSTLTSFLTGSPTINGTVTTWIGVDVPAVTAAGTNIGIRNRSKLQQKGALYLEPTTVTVTANAGTVPVTAACATFTNSSAAGMTVTMATSGALDGQTTFVRVFDATNVAQNITWVNTENGEGTVPATSNGNTTLPKTVMFQFNGSTSKWRCIIT